MDDADLRRLRTLAAARVQQEIPELLHEAMDEARARVRAQLTDAFSDALSARILEELAPAPPAVTEVEPGLGWYVYCVVAADAELTGEGPGVDPAHGVTTVTRNGLAAVVSRVPLSAFGEASLPERMSDMAWLEQTVRAHERVVEAIAAQTTAVPMRLCTVYRRDEGLAGMLEDERPALQDALELLSGTEEWGVKAFAGAAPEPVQDAASDRDGAGLNGTSGGSDGTGGTGGTGGSDGTAYMRRRLQTRQRRAEARSARDEACASIYDALSHIARQSRVNPVQQPEVSGRRLPMILNTAHLVGHEDVEAFHAEIDNRRRAASALGLELETTGPWPAYNFVPDTIGSSR